MNLREKYNELKYENAKNNNLINKYKELLLIAINEEDISIQFCCCKNISRIYFYIVFYYIF